MELPEAPVLPLEPGDLPTKLWQMRESGRTGIQVIPTQAPALDFGKKWGWRMGLKPDDFPQEGGLQLPVFAYDITKPSGEEGSKTYMVASYDAFCAYYALLPARQRFFYEVLQVGLPCHLYVDAEFKYRDNPELVGRDEWIHTTLCEELLFFLQKVGMTDREDSIHILSMDSSNHKKFSRHYVIRVDDRCFAGGQECGSFMRHFCNHMLLKYSPTADTPQAAGNPFFVKVVKTTTRTGVFVADLCVYTKNRCFRDYGSCKRGEEEYRPMLMLEEPRGSEPRPENLVPAVLKRTFIQWVSPEEARHGFRLDEPGGGTRQVHQQPAQLSPGRGQPILQARGRPAEYHRGGDHGDGEGGRAHRPAGRRLRDRPLSQCPTARHGGAPVLFYPRRVEKHPVCS